jgi:hypothetical protein
MARAHRMTPKRRAALKKAQAASARKRRGKGRGKLAAANRAAGPRSRVKRHLSRHGLSYAAVGVFAGAVAADHHFKKKRIAHYRDIAAGKGLPKPKVKYGGMKITPRHKTVKSYDF